jgi:hypothetical protein
MRTTLAVLLAGFSLLWMAPAVVAHHAIGGEYDTNKPVTLKGTVTKIEWTNPHARIYFDVAGPDGKVVNWNVELAARSALARQGWTARSLNVGDTVTVEGILARSGVSMVNARSVLLPDGRKVFSGENQ